MVWFAVKAPIKAPRRLAAGTVAFASLAAFAVVVPTPWFQIFVGLAAWAILFAYLFVATAKGSTFWRWMLNAAFGTVVAFGPLLAGGGSMAYFIVKNTESYERRFTETIASVPGTPYYAPDRAVPQSIEVGKVLGRTPEGLPIATSESAAYTVRQYRPAMAQAFLMVGAPLTILSLLGLFWGAVYFPAVSLAGLDLRRIVFPSDVFRVFGHRTRWYISFCLICAATAAVFVFIAAVAALAAYRLGSMPMAVLAAAAPAFYFWMVFASVLGSFRRSN